MSSNWITFPELYQVDQSFPDTGVNNVRAETHRLLNESNYRARVKAGDSVAVCVASRGTHDLKDLVFAVIENLKASGLRPFITPAMGSHGGSTGEGQASVLRGLGVTEEATGVAIKATMRVQPMGAVAGGPAVFTALDALEADHIVVINRVKPHTGFHSEVESGLCKILAVGLGRQQGAATMHKYDLARCIVPAAGIILGKAPVLFGIAVTENARGATQSIRFAYPDAFVATDRELLLEARALLPKLPIDRLDVLIVDEIGKNISGAGMDPNVIGFWRRGGGERTPDFRVLVVLDLTPESHGNGLGIGLADVTTRQFVSKVDWDATYKNALSSKRFTGVRMPMVVENDRRAIEVALDTVAEPATARLGRIRSTADLKTFWVSRPVLKELEGHPAVTLHRQPVPLRFDESGRLVRSAV